MIVALLFASFVIDVIAIVAVLWCLADAVADMRIVNQYDLQNGRRVVAWADVRGQAVRLATVMVMGAMVMLVIPVIDRAREPDLTSMAIFTMFTTAHLLIAANAVMDLGMRRRLSRESKERAGDESATDDARS